MSNTVEKRKQYIHDLIFSSGADTGQALSIDIQAEIAWQLKRIADQLASGTITIRRVGDF
jgi:hypothetical protein